MKKDKRNIFQIFFSVFKLKVDIIQILFFPEDFTHISILISSYGFGLLLDLTLNVLLFSDEVISQKYFNDGNLVFFTTVTISLLSNIFSNFISYFIEKLINFNELLENIVNEIKDKDILFLLYIRISRFYKVKVFIFFIIIFSLGLGFTYYIFTFCAIYKNMEKEIWKNYLMSCIESLIYTVTVTSIVTVFRKIAIVKKYRQLYIVSKYIDSIF